MLASLLPSACARKTHSQVQPPPLHQAGTLLQAVLPVLHPSSLVLHAHVPLGERLRQRALPRIGVPNDGHDSLPGAATAASLQLSRALHLQATRATCSAFRAHDALYSGLTGTGMQPTCQLQLLYALSVQRNMLRLACYRSCSTR